MFLQYDRIIQVIVAGLQLDDIRISFEYRNAADNLEQNSSITFYNLSESTHKQIVDLQLIPPHNIATVRAGYRMDAGLTHVFSGSVAWIERTAKNGSIRTIVHIGDRVKDYSPNWIEVSEKEISAREGVRKIAHQMGMDVANLDVIPYDIKRTNVSFSERGENALRTFLSSLRDEVPGLYWVQDKNKLFLAKGAEPRKDVGQILKTPTTGLIGVPRIEEDGRLTVKMLMDTRVELKGPINFKGSKYIDEKERYAIDKIVHRGDNWTGEFTTEVECIPPNYQALSSSGRIPQTALALGGTSRFGNNSDRNKQRVEGA